MRNLLIGLVVLGVAVTYVVLPVVLAVHYLGNDYGWVGILPVLLPISWLMGFVITEAQR